MGFPFGGFDTMFTIMPMFMCLIFAAIIGVIIFISINGAKQWSKNNNSPVLTVDATVVTKRIDVQNTGMDMHHHHGTGMDMHHNHMSSSTYTYYYATFQVASGDRIEFKIRNAEYGLLAENDTGKLTFQGTRYLGFERNRN